MHGFEGARADAHGSTGWVRLKLPTALGCFGSGDDSCVCAFTSAHGYGGAPLAGSWRGGQRLLPLMLVPARRARRCFQSPLPAARAARRSRRRRQRLTIPAPYNGEPWRIDGSVERARTPLAASTRHTASAHRSPTHTAEHTWTEDRQPPKTVVRHGGGLVRRTPDITALQLCLLLLEELTKRGTFPKTRYIYGWYLRNVPMLCTYWSDEGYVDPRSI